MSSQGEFLDNTLINSILFGLDQLAKSEHKFADYNKLAAAPDAKPHSLARLGQLPGAYRLGRRGRWMISHAAADKLRRVPKDSGGEGREQA